MSHFTLLSHFRVIFTLYIIVTLKGHSHTLHDCHTLGSLSHLNNIVTLSLTNNEQVLLVPLTDRTDTEHVLLVTFTDGTEVDH